MLERGSRWRTGIQLLLLQTGAPYPSKYLGSNALHSIPDDQGLI